VQPKRDCVPEVETKFILKINKLFKEEGPIYREK
jgi:hypothetical protein